MLLSDQERAFILLNGKKKNENALYFHVSDMKLDLTILSDKGQKVNLIQLSV